MRATEGARTCQLAIRPALAVGLLLGAMLVQQLPTLPGPVLLAAALIAGLGLLRIAGNAGLLSAGLLLGAAAAACAGQRSMAERIPADWDGREVRVVGRIVGLPEAVVRGWRIELEASKLMLGEQALPGPRRLRLSWFVNDPAFVPASGSLVEGRARLRRPRGLANPGGFDLEGWALVRRLAAQGYLVGEPIVRSGGGGLDALRQRLSARIGAHVGDQDTAALLRALALGDQGQLQDPQWDTLRATGVTHLVAISGFHIGAVALLAGALASGLWRLLPVLSLRWPRPQAAAAAGLLAAAAYSALAGMSVPVLRTLAMLAAVALARLLGRVAGAPQLLALALVVALVIDPLSPMTAGFWLSFAGVAWLVWAFHGRREAGLATGFVRAQLVAGIGLAPLTVLWFQQVSLAGIVANLVAVPLVTLVVVPALLLALALGLDATAPGVVLLDLAARLLATTWPWLERVAAWPHAEVHHALPSTLALLAALAGIALLLAPRGLALAGAGMALLLPLAWPRYPPLPESAFELVALDVGQGQAVLLRTRRHALLFDAGPAPAGRLDLGAAVVVPALRALGVRRLDALVVSHRDNDHAGGVPAVLRVHRGARVLRADGADGAGRCRAGERWSWDGVAFELLHPPTHFPYVGNESSCVLRVSSIHGSALLAGDIGALIEARLVREQRPRLRADLLLVPHHGSAGSSSPGFVAAVAPDLALASVGWRNRYGHPAPAVVARYQNAGARFGTTAGSGAIRVRYDGTPGAPAVVAERERVRRYWHEAAGTVR